MSKIILIGYMGSGKTTIANLLSEKMKIPAQDLDKIIEKNTGNSVSEIFSEKGEIHFRKLEHDVLKQLVNENDPMILGLGGGTPCYANNHSLLKGENVISIYLKGSIKTLAERLKPLKANRPLIASVPDEELEEFIAKHLFDRSFYYSHATYTVTIDGKTPNEVAQEIAAKLA